MKDATPKTIYLKDYKVPDYTITEIYLTFNLHDTQTNVKSKMKVERKCSPTEGGHVRPLVLNGEELVLKKVIIDGVELKEGEFQEADNCLIINNVPEQFVLEIENEINPTANTALDGLYKSGNMFCTQNEPEGFRRITYYLDRPDVMAKFTTKVIADKEKYPILLSNGNPVANGDLEGGKHFYVWEDPFPKPAYLYALVAGNLGLVQDSFTTRSGRKIDLRIYCDKGNESKCDHAMESLKNSMKWDEERFGLEYDLDIYMIVAVDSFNMGAMENKGLNIFNSAYVLANPQTATDDNFLGIEGVVAHEYFHNWTGNRITCRDWFQLTLKEGLTVFRDQEFSSDMNSRSVQRIGDVQRLRSFQFVEDAGPTAHPIKPDSYIEINNFYTATVYEKGAEVIRMIQTLLGRDGFRKGMDKYFELYDGQAVTTEDFLHAMSVANDNYDLTQFKRWYSQSGTPEIECHFKYDERNKSLTLKIEQSCPPTPGQDHKQPFLIPLKMGLLDKSGKELPLNLKTAGEQPQLDEGIIHFREKEETFVFENVESEPIVSLNRGFSAPIKVNAPYHNSDLAFLIANDTDEFNRFEAGQELSSRLMYKLIKDVHSNKEIKLDGDFVEAWGKVLADDGLDPYIKSLCLSIPAEDILHQGHSPIDFDTTHTVRRFVVRELAKAHKQKLLETYEKLNVVTEYKLDPHSIGVRELKNTCLGVLSLLEEEDTTEMTYSQFLRATNMTDEIGALQYLIDIDTDHRNLAVAQFYDKWKHETLVMQKWLSVQAASRLEDTFEKVLKLETDPVYDKNVPNLFRSLIGSFARNHTQFHHESGRGYQYIADRIIDLDAINPQMASRVTGAFKDYKRLQSGHKTRMKEQLERVLNHEGVSKNVYEIASKILH